MKNQFNLPADNPAIELISASVTYKIEHELKNHKSLIGQIFGIAGKKNNEKQATRNKALKGVSLRINSGERVGVVGKNGAGKSTLLKLIAGVVPGSEGLIKIDGSIQSLFDIGVGLEADASGRENIFFRSLIQGLTPKQAKERESEIIAFSGLGSFIDHPVKTYSAGMTVRLVYSIATFLDGNILLIDEIFGAGDNEFQIKAIDRMRLLINEAKIVVFTSHNLSLLSEMCTRGIFLHSGQILYDGQIDDAISAYLNHEKS